jgi:hypothetical protein
MDPTTKSALNRKFAAVLDQYDRALRDCPADLWESSLWAVKRHHFGVWPARRVDQKPSSARSREALLPVYSAFWNVAYHALFHVDFYLSGATIRGFTPPPPFREDEHRAGVVPSRPYTRAELHHYVAYNRDRARAIIDQLSERDATRVVARAGVPFEEFLLGTLLHTQEHAAQLLLFLGQHGVEPPGGPEAEARRQILRDGVRMRSDAEIDAFARRAGGYPRLLPLVFAGWCDRLGRRDPVTVRFDVGDSFVVRTTPDGTSFERTAPKAVDATLRLSPQDFLRWMGGDLDAEAAADDGRMTVDGDAGSLRRLLEPASPTR